MNTNHESLSEYVLDIDFINVGFGDSTYIELRGKGSTFNMLVDAGRPGTAHYENNPQRIKTYEYLKKRGIININLLVATHFHQDHVGGLKEIAENIHVDTFWCNYLIPENHRGIELNYCDTYPDGCQRLVNAINIYNYVYFTLKDKNTQICCTHDGYNYSSGIDGIDISVLWPDLKSCRQLAAYVDEIYSSKDTASLAGKLDILDKCLNDFCVILKVMYHNTSLLLAGDGGDAFWSEFESNSDLNSTILKLPHHGQKDSFSERLFKMSNPDYVVISAANDWTYNCPDRNAVEKIADFGVKNNGKCRLFFTDAIDMSPYSTKEDIKNLIRFYVTGSGVTGISKLMLK